MKPIDPAEATLAVIGIRPLLTREIERITMEQAHEIADYGKKLYAEAKRIVRGEKSSVPLGSINYRTMLNQLFSDEFNQEQIIGMVMQFPPVLHAVTSDFFVDAGLAIKYLRQLFPREQKQTQTSVVQALQPSALAIRRFVNTFDVLDKPMRILAHIATGSLLKSQMQAVRELYPTISPAIDDAFDEAKAYELAQKKSFQLPPLVQIGLTAWKGLPRVTPQLQSRLQNNFAAAKQTQQGQPRPQTEGTSQSIIAKESLTNTQKALFPQTTKAG